MTDMLRTMVLLYSFEIYGEYKLVSKRVRLVQMEQAAGDSQPTTQDEF